MTIKSRIEGNIEYVHCENASELLDYLQLRNPRWLLDKEHDSTWVFRGQQKAEWPLLPSALCSTTTWFDEFQ